MVAVAQHFKFVAIHCASNQTLLFRQDGNVPIVEAQQKLRNSVTLSSVPTNRPSSPSRFNPMRPNLKNGFPRSNPTASGIRHKRSFSVARQQREPQPEMWHTKSRHSFAPNHPKKGGEKEPSEGIINQDVGPPRQVLGRLALGNNPSSLEE